VCDPSLVWFLWAERRLCARTDLQTFRCWRKTKDWFDWAVCVTELVWFLWAKFSFQFKNWPLDFQREARIDFFSVCVCVCVCVCEGFFVCDCWGRFLLLGKKRKKSSRVPKKKTPVL
jgi:hypothetical protein